MRISHLVRSESTKLLTAPSTWVISAATILGTWPQAWSNAAAHTLPPDDPRLFGEPTPVAYHGFELAGFGYTFVVVLGALWAAAEYGGGQQIHATLTATPDRGRVLAVKLSLLALLTALIAVLSMGGAIMITHAATGDGVHPLLLTPQIWALLAGLTAAWVLTALIAFALGILARTAVLPLIVLMPLVIGLGGFLAGIWDVAAYFPVTAGSALYTAPGSDVLLDPATGGLVHAAWAVVLVTIASIAFARRDA